MNPKNCEGCIYFGKERMRCYCDIEELSGRPLSEFSICSWDSRRIKNKKAADKRRLATIII